MTDPIAVTFAAGLDKANCLKCNPDGSGTILFSFPMSEGAKAMELFQRFRQKPLFLSAVLADDSVLGRKAED